MMMMSVEENLLLEIFARLPSKSIARFCCVSKLWKSLLESPYLTQLFLTHSRTRPRLLFAVYTNDDHKWSLYSSPQPHNSNSSSSSLTLLLTAEFQMSFPNSWSFQMISPPQLSDNSIYHSKMLNTKFRQHPVMCNPSTGHILWLPPLTSCSYFGYDPIDKIFKVLCITQGYPPEFYILNFGYGQELSWRNLASPLPHIPHHQTNTCINGALYYTATSNSPSSHNIVCFDLNSHQFNFVDHPWSYGDPIDLVNFKGKLCGIAMKWVMLIGSDERFNLELSLWILEDFEKEEWSEHFYHLPLDLCNKKNVCVVGVTVTGDIVLSSYNTNNPFYVYFFNPKKNTVQKIEVQGFENSHSNMIYSFVDYVEDLRTF